MTNVYSMFQLNIFDVSNVRVKIQNRTILESVYCFGAYVHLTRGPGRCFDSRKAGELPGSGPAALDDVIELFSGRKYHFTRSAVDAQCS